MLDLSFCGEEAGGGGSPHLGSQVGHATPVPLLDAVPDRDPYSTMGHHSLSCALSTVLESSIYLPLDQPCYHGMREVCSPLYWSTQILPLLVAMTRPGRNNDHTEGFAVTEGNDERRSWALPAEPVGQKHG